MTTVLFYLVIAAVIGLVVFFLAVLVFGRGEQMAPLDPRTSPAELPDHDINSDDIQKIRFALALRGYRMSDVDWTLERLGEQIDSLRLENAHLREQVALPEPAPLADQVTGPDSPGPDNAMPNNPVPTNPVPTNPVPNNPVPNNPVPNNLVPNGPVPTNPAPDSVVPKNPVPHGSAPDGGWHDRAEPDHPMSDDFRPQHADAREAEPAGDR